MDSKHRVLMNNYQVTALGFFDAGQQFNLIAMALSNKEDKNMYWTMIQGVETVLQSIGVHMDPEYTMFNNCDAIQKSFLRYYPNGSIGGFFFHLLQNIKKKHSPWNIAVPSAISSSQKSRFILRARDARERFAQEGLRWLSTLSFIHVFTIFSDLFLQMLHAQGYSDLSDTLRAEYSQGIKRG
jgi:MULE transposase domain